MNRGFLYRRLARWITCELQMLNGTIRLSDKFQVASLQDVFCTPFYWQLHAVLQRAPELVVDCGAHCGHFMAVAEACIRYKFGGSAARYILVEADPAMVRRIRQTVQSLGMGARAEVVHAAVGAPSGAGEEATLWVNAVSPLSTSLTRTSGTRPLRVKRTDLASLTDRRIDLLKVDIEGAEYDLVEQDLGIFAKVDCLFMEMHATTPERRARLLAAIDSVGLSLVESHAFAGNDHAIFSRA